VLTGMETPLQPAVREGPGSPGKASGRNGLEECDGRGVDCGAARRCETADRAGLVAMRAEPPEHRTYPHDTACHAPHNTHNTTQHDTKKQRGPDALAHLAALFLGSVPRVALDAVPGVWPPPLSVCLSVCAIYDT
jgi:hypothetical protein